MADAAVPRHGVFGECSIAFVPSRSLAPKLISELSSVIQDNGATICEPRRDGSLPIEKLTHIVSNTIDFPQYTESQGLMIPVVTTQWLSSSISRRRVTQVRPYSPDPRMIFAEVTVSCADLPKMDKETIIGAVMALGGQESKDIGRLTTHVCALSMDHPKVQAGLQRGFKGKVVLPHWFDDCFKLGKRIDEAPYILPDPEILRKTAEDDLDIPVNDNVTGATSANPQRLPLPPDSEVARSPLTVFQDKCIMLSSDLGISERHLRVVTDIITKGGGRMVDEVDHCDLFICQYREGEDYVRASQSCKVVGNLSWLYYLIIHDEWASPLRRLLHYPIPKNGIPGFEKLMITYSNYGGDSRIYLENLIKACGAEFTKTMRQDNTHLITARITSEKCKTAPEWGIAVTNHLWIEESYAKCEMRPINVPKYNHFPPRTNLGEIVGQTFFNESRLRELYYPGGEDNMSPRAKRKRKILEAAEDNAYPHGPAEGLAAGRTGLRKSKEFDVRHDDKAADSPSKRKTSKPSNAVATPIRSRHVSTGKENDTPSVISTGGRSAKAKARDMLTAVASDIALYEKEKKRSSKTGSAPWGGKRAADQAEKEKTAKQAAAHANDNDEEESTRPAKKHRPSLPDVEMRVMLTGFERWVGDKNREDHDRRKLRDMGIQIVAEGQHCDYLAAPQIVRTVKFLTALARGPTVISANFIEKALESGRMPSVDRYILDDEENEQRFDIKLDTSVARAKANKGRLLWGVPIYCTEKVRNGPDSYRAIAESNSAIFKMYRARSGTTIKPTTAEEDGGAPPEPVYLLSCNSPDEKQLWSRFEDMARKGNMEPRVVAPDWLLDVAMAQEVRFDEAFLVTNFYN